MLLPSATPTATACRTATSTRSLSYTGSRSASACDSATRSLTPSALRSGSRTTSDAVTVRPSASPAATRAATPTPRPSPTSTLTATPSVTPSATSTVSLGNVLVTKDLAQPAVLLALSLAPLTGADVDGPVVGALRAALLRYIPDYSGAAAPLARAPVLDQVLLAAAVDLGASASGGRVEYNASHALNTAGNIFNASRYEDPTDALFNFLVAQSGAPAQELPPAGDGSGSGSGSGSGALSAAAASPSAGAARRILRNDGSGGAGGAGALVSASASGRARGLQITLQYLPSPPRRPGTVNLQFNILTPTMATASALKEEFAAWQREGRLPARRAQADSGGSGSGSGGLLEAVRLALIASNRSAQALALTGNVTGVEVVRLAYRRSFWSLLLDFLRRNILNVLAGSVTLICVVGLLACWNWCKRRRSKAAAALKKARRDAALAGIREGVREAAREAAERARAAAAEEEVQLVVRAQAREVAAEIARQVAERDALAELAAALPPADGALPRGGVPERFAGGAGGGGRSLSTGTMLPRAKNGLLARAAAAALLGVTASRAFAVKKSQAQLREASRLGRAVAGEALGSSSASVADSAYGRGGADDASSVGSERFGFRPRQPRQPQQPQQQRRLSPQQLQQLMQLQQIQQQQQQQSFQRQRDGSPAQSGSGEASARAGNPSPTASLGGESARSRARVAPAPAGAARGRRAGASASPTLPTSPASPPAEHAQHAAARRAAGGGGGGGGSSGGSGGSGGRR